MPDILLLIAGMTLVTYLPRWLPMLLLSSRPLPGWLTRWLSMVAPAIFGALLAPALFLAHTGEPGTASYARDYSYLIAAVPAFAAGWFFRSFLATIAAGMGAMALLRFFPV